MAENTSDEQIAVQVTRIPEMFGFLIDRYEEKLDRYISRQTNLPKDLRDDVLQDVFIKSYQNIASFDPTQSFNSWIYRICHNTIINDWKKNKRYRDGLSFGLDSNTFLHNIASDENAAIFAENNIQQEQIKCALGKIKEKFRSILILRYFEELSYDEISDILHIPSGTVATHIFRAKKALAKQLPTNQ